MRFGVMLTGANAECDNVASEVAVAYRYLVTHAGARRAIALFDTLSRTAVTSATVQLAFRRLAAQSGVSAPEVGTCLISSSLSLCVTPNGTMPCRQRALTCSAWVYLARRRCS